MRSNANLTGDELMTVHDMANSNPYVLSKNEKYWHPELGSVFKNGLFKLWG